MGWRECKWVGLAPCRVLKAWQGMEGSGGLKVDCDLLWLDLRMPGKQDDQLGDHQWHSFQARAGEGPDQVKVQDEEK